MNQTQRNQSRIARRASKRSHRGNCYGLREVVANQFGLVKTSVKIPPTYDITHAGANPPTREQFTSMPELRYYAPKSDVRLGHDQPFDQTLAAHDGNHALGRMISRVEVGRDNPEYEPEIIARAIDLIAKGNRVQTACNIAGIPHETFVQWIERYPEFKQAVEVALSTAEADRLDMIVQIAEKPSVITKRILLPDGSERVEETTSTKHHFPVAKYLLERRFACDDWPVRPNAPEKANDKDITVNYVHSYPEPK